MQSIDALITRKYIVNRNILPESLDASKGAKKAPKKANPESISLSCFEEMKIIMPDIVTMLAKAMLTE